MKISNPMSSDAKKIKASKASISEVTLLQNLNTAGQKKQYNVPSSVFPHLNLNFLIFIVRR